ncbi:MAG: hypothetical protein FWC60_12920, partial [Firmicutes bacterium]|nr:hypothetical protein [Bacillota bacterium]
MKKINRAAIKFASLMLAVMFLMGIPSLAALADKTSGVGSEQLANSSIGQDVYTSNKDLLAIMPTDTSLGIDYSSNSKFITPFDPPVASAIPISNKAELEAISNNLNGSFYLTADIDLSGAQWAPIGDKINPFTGTFDGQGHIISNLTINIPNANGTENNGLFGYAKNGMIKNLGIESAAISCYRTYGSVNAGGICGISDSLIVNCYNTGMITIYSDIAGMEDYAVYAGGICGISNSPVSNCYNTGTVTAYSAYDPFNTLGYTYAGGICGLNNSSNYNCYNTGTVTALGCAGGICGSGSFISNCYNTGNVDAANMMYSTYAGGICGYSENPITNCYNMGTMTARNNRISTYSSVFSYTGGICGKSKSLVSYCYNTGNALSDDSGNICGYSTNVSNCYYLYRHEY